MTMAELATLSQDKTLQLPDEIAKHFHPSDKFVVWLDRDTLHLKRLPPSPLKAVADAPAEKPLSLDEINDIVHEVRKQRSQDTPE
jgi:hypothetical protein